MPATIERPTIGRAERATREDECATHKRQEATWRARAARSHSRQWRRHNPHRCSAQGEPALASQSQSLFDRLADQWRDETAFESIVARKAMHPAYQRIIGMGAIAVPLLLRRLQRQPGQWFWALTAITGEDPAAGETTVEGACSAWLRWGRDRGLVGD